MDIQPRKKPTADFIIRLTAEGLRPWSVPARNLARILEAVQRLIDQREESDDDEKEDGPDGARAGPSLTASVVRLIDIKTGSAAYQVASPSPEAAVRLLSETATAIGAPDKAEWTQPTLSSLKELSDVARSLGCIIEFRRPPTKGQSYGSVLATIRPETYEAISGSAFVSGHTSVFAKIERVGGVVEKHCGIHVRGQARMVICRVGGEDLVRQLGKYIYHDVVLIGTATWLRKSLHLKSFHITAFEPPKTGSVLDALQNVYDAGGKVWDTIPDPDGYIAEMRRA